MKKEILFTVLLVFSLTLASATISLEQQPKQMYNMGDTIDLPLKIIASQQINDLISVKLICGEIQTEIYKEYISLVEGEKLRDITIPLIKSFVGESTGTCAIYYELGLENGNLSLEFTISNKIDIIIQEFEQEFSPGEKVIISGTAIKRNGKGVDGTIEANLSTETSSNMIYTNLIEGGEFSLEINLPQNLKAGQHAVNLYAYEKDSNNNVLNNGSLITNINVKQIPSNLEIIIDNPKANPGESLKIKVVLHDQTGENIEDKVYLAVKNPEEKVIEKIEKTTGEQFEYYINSTEPPSVWKINVYSAGLSTTTTFTINEKKQIKTEILNSTLIITNTGNVIYQDTIDVKIGKETKRVDLNLKIGESRKFTLTAPKGEYLVQIGEESKTVGLTGKSIDIKKFSERNFSLKLFVWIFIILILSLIAYMLFKKGYKRTFFGRRHLRFHKVKHKKIKKNETITSKLKSKEKLINPEIPVELSLSIHGNKQTSDIINLNLKNYEHLSSGQGGIKETLNKISNLIEEHKGLVYQSQENLFFIFAPEKTRTFKHQDLTIGLAKEITKILEHHNKLFKQKIEYGLAIDSGELIIKSDKNSIKFTAITALMTNLKRMSTVSNKQIFLSERIRNDLASKIKVNKVDNNKINAYALKEIVVKPDHSKFITGFMERLERDKKVKKKS